MVFDIGPQVVQENKEDGSLIVKHSLNPSNQFPLRQHPEVHVPERLEGCRYESMRTSIWDRKGYKKDRR